MKGIKYKFLQQLTLILQKYLNLIISLAVLHLFYVYHCKQMLKYARRDHYADNPWREVFLLLFLIEILLHFSPCKSKDMSYKKPPHMGLNRSNQYSPFLQEHGAYISNNIFISSYFLIDTFVSRQLQQPLLGLHYPY